MAFFKSFSEFLGTGCALAGEDVDTVWSKLNVGASKHPLVGKYVHTILGRAKITLCQLHPRDGRYLFDLDLGGRFRSWLHAEYDNEIHFQFPFEAEDPASTWSKYCEEHRVNEDELAALMGKRGPIIISTTTSKGVVSATFIKKGGKWQESKLASVKRRPHKRPKNSASGFR